MYSNVEMNEIYQKQNTWNKTSNEPTSQPSFYFLSGQFAAYFSEWLSFYFLAATSSFVVFFFPYSSDLDRFFYVFMNACQMFNALIQYRTECSSIRGGFLRSQCAAYLYFLSN